MSKYIFKDRITNRICCGEVDSQAASSSTKQKDEYVRSKTQNNPTVSTKPRNEDISRFVCKLIRDPEVFEGFPG